MAAIAADPLSPDHPPHLGPLLAFAGKLTRDPHGMTRADVQALREHGFTDRGVLEAVEVTAYFNFVNRLVDGLGVSLEPDWEG
ncbi:MAG: hypothetical protein RQ751_07540 [Longimicrobiales bacterium]|nr:hypothetical protein [Longimicrobiales bacterium]